MIHVHLIRGIIVSVITSSTVDRGFDPWLDQTKDYKIGVCYFTDERAALRSKSKEECVRQERHVYPRTLASVCEFYIQPTNRVALVQSGHHYHYHLIKSYNLL